MLKIEQYGGYGGYGGGIGGGFNSEASGWLLHLKKTFYGGSYGALQTNGHRRQGRYRRQVIRVPGQGQGQVRQVRQRLPTPEPDTLERVYIQSSGQEIIEEITEIPTTPPPQVHEKTIVEPSGPPQVIRKVIRVPPRSGGYSQGGYAQQGGYSGSGSFGTIGQAQANYGGYGSYGSGSGGYEQYGPGYTQNYAQQVVPSYSSGHTIQSYAPSNFGQGQQLYGGYPQYGGQQQTSSFYGYQQQQRHVQPPVGVSPAFCFYV
ncbi:unnamed protein product [Didymodactylos carnosus]|uniref:Uncharacterized protein n=1 Tax=Didymodactylos carnosus TaxID=1234261 RepID=A0A814KBP2_9BILA|nr:unnamed protein product [Didymodactylos carnosus]CAF3817017.1 unnamed protein product [Didymodactylos carnosus]